MRKPIPIPSFLDRCEAIGAFGGEKRWRSADGKRLYTWDSLHGEIEVFDKRGNHLGAVDAVVENGNTVPLSVSVQSAMTAAEHVRRIAIFTELNPQPEVAVFHLGPANGNAQVSTRMRMASSQNVIAMAVMNDGSVWQHRVAVSVALAACLEGE